MGIAIRPLVRAILAAAAVATAPSLGAGLARIMAPDGPGRPASAPVWLEIGPYGGAQGHPAPPSLPGARQGCGAPLYAGQP
jgi:hypothetical protein